MPTQHYLFFSAQVMSKAFHRLSLHPDFSLLQCFTVGDITHRGRQEQKLGAKQKHSMSTGEVIRAPTKHAHEPALCTHKTEAMRVCTLSKTTGNTQNWLKPKGVSPYWGCSAWPRAVIMRGRHPPWEGRGSRRPSSQRPAPHLPPAPEVGSPTGEKGPKR